jgi:peptidoglycan-associated lipoprotein
MKFSFKIICIIMSVLTFACTNDIQETNRKPLTTNSPIDFGEVEYFTKVIGQTILFDIDNTGLNENARYILTSQAAWLVENNKYKIIINGYADEQGTRGYNLALGAKRSAVVRDFLVLNGVDEVRLKTSTFGKERPLKICSSEKCYSANRRTVTTIHRN